MLPRATGHDSTTHQSARIEKLRKRLLSRRENVRLGSWLCENADARNIDSYKPAISQRRFRPVHPGAVIFRWRILPLTPTRRAALPELSVPETSRHVAGPLKGLAGPCAWCGLKCAPQGFLNRMGLLRRVEPMIIFYGSCWQGDSPPTSGRRQR